MGTLILPEPAQHDVDCMSALWHHVMELKHKVLLTPLDGGRVMQVDCQEESCDPSEDGTGPWWDHWDYQGSIRYQLSQEVRGG